METDINEKRNHRRLKLRCLIAGIADENIIIHGHVKDISLSGFRVSHLSHHFKIQEKKYLISISGYKKNYVFSTQPCLANQHNCDEYQEIGFMITQSSPDDWSHFIDSMILEYERYENWVKTGVASFS